MIFKKLKTISKQTKIAIIIIVINFIVLSIIAHFRFANYDEKLYLHETVMMSEILKQGKWIGNYGVGVHGFIFKLPVALLFIITGPSIYVATLFNIIISSITIWIFYLLLKKYIKTNKWTIPIILIFLLNFRYFSYSLTFYRDIPNLFSTILFLYFLISNNKKTLLNSFLLLLVLDSKESTFFVLLPTLFIYILLIKKNIFSSIKNIFLLLLPSLIYLYLMFNSSIIPINMFNASLLGLTEKAGLITQIQAFLPTGSLQERFTVTNNISNTFNLTKYLKKLYFLENFSFQGISLIFFITTLITSMYLFKKWNKKNNNLIILLLFYLIYIVIYILRYSHERYLLPILPINIILLYYFINFVRKQNKTFNIYFIYILYLSLLVIILIPFYQNISYKKFFFNITMNLTFFFLYILFFLKKIHKKYFFYTFFLIIILSSLFIDVYSLLNKNHIYYVNLWGINGEVKKISKLIKPQDIIYINSCDNGCNSEYLYLINFYRKNNYLPIEWKWKLNKNKINRQLDEIPIKSNLYYDIPINNLEEFKTKIKEKNINKIILLKSTFQNEKFPLEDYIDILKNEKWVKLEKIEQLKNKEVYIFTVN